MFYEAIQKFKVAEFFFGGGARCSTLLAVDGISHVVKLMRRGQSLKLNVC